jgi:urease accessory protein
MTDATLSLRFVLSEGKTVLNVLRQEPPWRALRAFRNSSNEALIHLHNVSGGVLGGDQLRLDATLDESAQAQITAVGATRIYRAAETKPTACQLTRLCVSSGALLEYLPDTVIPFAGSRFEQRSEVRLAHGAGLIWWESVSAGRIASGESFAFEKLLVDTTIFALGKPIAKERYSLQPVCQQLSLPTRFGKFLYSSTMYVCLVGRKPSDWTELEHEMNTTAEKLSTTGAMWGASTLVSDGVVIRGMTQNGRDAQEGLTAMWRIAKERIWERPAVAPRKIY